MLASITEWTIVLLVIVGSIVLSRIVPIMHFIPFLFAIVAVFYAGYEQGRRVQSDEDLKLFEDQFKPWK